eukprot:TRINITY_DN3140_c0_g2_i1.p1 TRINITY_DN3140_c0_g2~~TRINITY_DN3140_c0_g2_i1.p1  ORF type:complete len:203 (-),score=35.64 TRINITY_DN3140_c0_g2_i1:70-678(-)
MSAGTDTTAHLVQMCVYYLLKYPEFQERIRKEACTVVPEVEKDGFANISLDDISQMKFLHAFIKETLRLSPPVGFLFSLLACKDHNLGDIMIKKGTQVNIPLAVIGQNSRFFNNPQEFRPERWLNEEEVKQVDPFIDLAFSSGSRNCIGQHLARIEAKLILVKLLCGFNMKFSNPDYRLRLGLKFLYGPMDPLLVDFEPRSN